jgi:hypothetical protein
MTADNYDPFGFSVRFLSHSAAWRIYYKARELGLPVKVLEDVIILPIAFRAGYSSPCMLEIPKLPSQYQKGSHLPNFKPLRYCSFLFTEDAR